MVENLFLKSVVEAYPWVVIHYRDDNQRPLSVGCSHGQDIEMVDDSTIAVALAVKEHQRTRVRLATIKLERVLMIVAEHSLTRPDRLERLFLVRGADGRFECVRTEVYPSA